MYARHDDAFAPQPAAAPQAQTPSGGLGHSLLEWAKRLQRSRIERRAEAALASMDEHLLRDIGAHRGDLSRLVREGRD
ncbi:MAG: DUF1127 domain-containing protein [Rhodobacteraceae bacterium]|nr:DUF1127 domain-containing protein [Paracoccaceae bacterium]